MYGYERTSAEQREAAKVVESGRDLGHALRVEKGLDGTNVDPARVADELVGDAVVRRAVVAGRRDVSDRGGGEPAREWAHP